MSSQPSRGKVVDLAAARARRRQAQGSAPRERSAAERLPRTVILQVANTQADGEVHRQIGLNDALTLHELHEILILSFALSGTAPWHFSNDGERLRSSCHVREFLREEGDDLLFHWGLWQFTLRTAHIYPRDRGTPRALCIGGSGAFGDADFDLAAINAALTGEKTIGEVLANTREAVRGIIERSEIFDFVPLLQALDLTREVGVSESVRKRLAGLPVEQGAVAADAFWTAILALASMSEEEALRIDIVESTMAALGWTGAGGAALSGVEIGEMCRESLAVLAEVGGYGEDALAPVDRLDIYRELLRE